MKKYKILIAVIAIVLGALSLGGDQFKPPAVLGQVKTTTPMQTITIEGVTMYEEQGWYVSDTLLAPIPFNALVAEWTDDHTLYFELRTGTDGRWSPWIPLVHSHDLADGETIYDEHREIGHWGYVFRSSGRCDPHGRANPDKRPDFSDSNSPLNRD